MVIADPHIVHDLPVAGIVDFFHRDPPILRVYLVAGVQVAAGRPAFDTFEERVFQRRAEVLPTRVQTGERKKGTGMNGMNLRCQFLISQGFF